MSLSETLKIVKDFLKDINPVYPILLEELMNNGVVNIYDITDEKKLKNMVMKLIMQYIMVIIQ